MRTVQVLLSLAILALTLAAPAAAAPAEWIVTQHDGSGPRVLRLSAGAFP